MSFSAPMAALRVAASVLAVSGSTSFTRLSAFRAASTVSNASCAGAGMAASAAPDCAATSLPGMISKAAFTSLIVAASPVFMVCSNAGKAAAPPMAPTALTAADFTSADLLPSNFCRAGSAAATLLSPNISITAALSALSAPDSFFSQAALPARPYCPANFSAASRYSRFLSLAAASSRGILFSPRMAVSSFNAAVRVCTCPSALACFNRLSAIFAAAFLSSRLAA